MTEMRDEAALCDSSPDVRILALRGQNSRLPGVFLHPDIFL